ncbi:Na/Pi symporter [Flexibacterium corallicola]|uniref:Na/Pi symporter n=1 Tax=Flexibacterium corallicola TaxID=3037259 RepID=UPI00286ED5DC|nr:Na/Pi symporter [Pseudovibrio sp. M1P-2-3]
MNHINHLHDEEPHNALGISALNWLSVAFLMYLLLCAVGLIEAGFTSFSRDQVAPILAFATNPVAGLMSGILATAIIQSSSVVTATLVGLVAGGLPISIAIPIVIGANFGTTITNSLVSLGFAKNKQELKRAFSAATVHDAFNLICLLIFFPLEIMFSSLEKTIGFLVQRLSFPTVSTEYLGNHLSFLQVVIKPFVEQIRTALSAYAQPIEAVVLTGLGIGLLMLSIGFMSQILKMLMVGRAKNTVGRLIGKSYKSGLLSGTLSTLLVQSSSTTTSLGIPLVASGTLTTRNIYPFTLGANLATCITAVLAALAVTGNRMAALEIALVHLAYNTLGIVLISALPIVRWAPVHMAEFLGRSFGRSVLLIITYIATVYFLIPATAILIFH